MFDTAGLTTDTSGTVLFSVAENATAVGTLAAADPDAADTDRELLPERRGRRPVQHLRHRRDYLQQPRPTSKAPQGGADDDSNEYAFTIFATTGINPQSLVVRLDVKVTVTDVTPPAKPAAPTFGTATTSSVAVNWLAPASPGAAITDYDVQFREGTTGNFGDHPHTGTARTTTLASLTSGAELPGPGPGHQRRGHGRVVGRGHGHGRPQHRARVRRDELRLHAGGERRREHHPHRARHACRRPTPIPATR